MKTKKLIALVLAVLTITMAFAPNALAAYAPSSWSSWPTIQQGTLEHAFVVAAQVLINMNRGAGMTVDGLFGSTTKTKVKEFQSQEGISNDGIIGSETWGKMRAKLTTIRNWYGDGNIQSINLGGDSINAVEYPHRYYVKRGTTNYTTYSHSFNNEKHWQVYTVYRNDGSYHWYDVVYG